MTMRIDSCIVESTLCMFLILGATAAKGEDVALRQKFEAQAPMQWNLLRTHFCELRADVSDSAKWPQSENGRHESQVVTYNGSKECFRYDSKVTGQEGDTQHTLICLNSDYAFVTKRSGESEPYKVSYVGEDRDRVIHELQNYYAAFPGLMLHLVPIDDLFVDPSCRITDVAGVNIGSDRCVRVAFESQFTPRESYTVLNGETILDPARMWALRQFKMEVQHIDGIAFHSGSVEYDGPAASILPRRLLHEVRLGENAPVRVRREIEYQNVAPGDVDCKDCTMAAAGLPEPGFRVASQRSRSLFLWLNVAGVVCAAIAVVLRRRSLKAKRG
jgi:hypothetical protein